MQFSNKKKIIRRQPAVYFFFLLFIFPSKIVFKIFLNELRNIQDKKLPVAFWNMGIDFAVNLAADFDHIPYILHVGVRSYTLFRSGSGIKKACLTF